MSLHREIRFNENRACHCMVCKRNIAERRYCGELPKSQRNFTSYGANCTCCMCRPCTNRNRAVNQEVPQQVPNTNTAIPVYVEARPVIPIFQIPVVMPVVPQQVPDTAIAFPVVIPVEIIIPFVQVPVVPMVPQQLPRPNVNSV